MIAVTSRIKFLFFAVVLLIAVAPARAQDNDYLKHGKVFNYCSLRHVCAGCYDCEDKRYEIKIKNNQDKKIKSVHYKVYAPAFDHTETKEAKIEGDIISGQSTGLIYICVPDIKHWAISEITYDDNSSYVFVVKGGLADFVQEPDDCDCN